MKKRIFCLAIFFVLIPATSFAESFEGPLVVKNGQPLYTALNSPSLVSAEPENSVNINFSYSSTYVVEGNRDWYVGIDLETAVLDIQYKQVVSSGLEIGFDLPVIRYNSGFFDNTIDTYHRLIGMPNAYGRKERPQNDFLLDVIHNGNEVIRGKPNDSALGDIMIEVKKNLYQNDSSMVSIQAFLNLPTGDPKSSYGSGKTNGGIAALVNEQLRSDIMLYINTGIGLIHELTAIEDVELKNYYYGGTGLEWRSSPKVLLNLQIIIETSPFPKMGINSMDAPSMMASFGGSYKINAQSSFGLSLTEDPNVAGAPDIMMGLDYRQRF